MPPFSWIRRSSGLVEAKDGKQRLKGDLCQFCRNIDALALLNGKKKGRTVFGSLKDISEREGCALCDIVFAMLRQFDPSQEASAISCHLAPGSDDLGRFVLVAYQGAEQGHFRVFSKKKDELSLFVRERPSADSLQILNLALIPWRESFSQVESQEVAYFSLEINVSPDRGQVSIPLIRGWLDECENHHQETCSRTVLQERLGRTVDLLLIDVANKCLVRATSKSRYVALSYVWGGVQCLQATRSNLKALHRPGALLMESLALPLVIQDAFALVAALQQQYPWTDSLCIVQDDAEQKHRDINQMDVIYSHAVLTIVALSGLHANANLPGIRPESRKEQIDVTIGNLRCVVAPVPLQDMLKRSPLEYRAWTMQERMLSKRCLYFSEQQVYFQCLKKVQFEITVTGYWEKGIHTALSLNPLASARLRQYNDTGWSWQFDIYRDLVGAYTQRELSYTSDIINAFSGVTGAMEKCGSGSFICGIPQRALHVGLLWIPAVDGLTRRQTGTSFICPSWSWAGWVGPVEWPSSLTRGVQCMQSVSARNGPITMPYLGIDSDAIIDPTLDRKRNVLEFWALTTRKFDLRPGVESGLRDRTLYKIHNPAGIHCGIIYGGHDLRDGPDVPFILEYVLLSTLMLDESFLEMYRSTGTAIFDKEHYSPTKRCLVNVMLIEWKFEFAERVGLCQIHKDAWEASMPEMKVIRLM